MGNGWEGSDHTRTSTPEHRAWSKAVLQRDNHQCQIRGPRCTGVATQADHIREHSEGGPLTLDNGQAVCVPCHLQKTSEHANRTRWANRGTHPTETHPAHR